MTIYDDYSDSVDCLESINYLLGNRSDISKSLNPLDKDDFVIISTRIANALSGIAKPHHKAALKAVLSTLDVEWSSLSSEAIQRIIAATRAPILAIPNAIIPPIALELTTRGQRIVRGIRNRIRSTVANVGSRINVSLSLKDQRLIDHMVSSQGFFVTNEYGRRSEHFTAKAKEIVSTGLDQGLGQDAIANSLRSEIGSALGARRSGMYFNIIANNFVGRSRTYGQLVSYEEAGIERYQFVAVLDERTTDICALLDGKVWNVSNALERHRQVEASDDPQAIKDIMPWVRNGTDENGNRILYSQTRNGDRTVIAEVVRSRVGNLDDRGEFKNVLNDRALQEISANQPPLHPLCRSTIVSGV